jgi:hypothetical protein
VFDKNSECFGFLYGMGDEELAWICVLVWEKRYRDFEGGLRV